MIWRRLLLVVCALFLGGAAAQTPIPEIGRQVLWNLVHEKLQTINANEFKAMFDEVPPPGALVSDYKFVTTFNINGTTVRVLVGGNHALYAWSYAASQGFPGDSSYQCFSVGRCDAGVKIEENGATTPTNDYKFEVKDGFGSTGGVFSIGSTSSQPIRYRGVLSGGLYGQYRGAGNIFSSNPLALDNCGGGWTGASDYFDTYDEAYGTVTSKLNSVALRWAMKARSCVAFTQYLNTTGSLVGAWIYALDDARRRNANPTAFFDLEGISVVDDTPSQEDLQDSDGDGIKDADDPNPYGQQDTDGDGTPDRYDDTPNGEEQPNQWDVAPGDDETQCQIINIPCNLRKLFIPQVDWGAEWREMRDVMEQKLPFAYISWLASGSNAAQAQNIGVNICAPVQFDNVSLDWCNSEVMVWWRQFGVAMLFAGLYVTYLVNVVVRVRA